MPTAEDFDAAAAAFDAAAQTTGTLIDPARVIMGEGVMVGGQLTDLVTTELDTAAGMLDRITAELNRLAAECRERAETVRQSMSAEAEYNGAYEAYRGELAYWQERDHAYGVGSGHEAGPVPQAPPPPPTRPSWAGR
jgi:hypothetical protein